VAIETAPKQIKTIDLFSLKIPLKSQTPAFYLPNNRSVNRLEKNLHAATITLSRH
jgi:hypothetical protein